MAFTEDLSIFLADFGQPCTLAGAAVTAIVDHAGVEDPDTGVITQALVARVTALAAATATPGQAFVNAAGVAHTVRRVLPDAPDGAFVLLVLARS